MKKLRKEYFLRVRINEIEKQKLIQIEEKTGRNRSDLVRDAVSRIFKQDYPENE